MQADMDLEKRATRAGLVELLPKELEDLRKSTSARHRMWWEAEYLP